MKRVTNGFDKLSIAEFSLKLNLIVTSMSGNVNFPTLQTAVQTLSTEADAYYPLVTLAEQLGTTAKANRDAAREKIIKMLHALGAMVTGVAEDNEAILSSSGFKFTQPARPTPLMKQPAPPVVSPGVNGGQIDCKTSRQNGMKSVNYYITTDEAALAAKDGSGWDVVSYNKTKYAFSGLTSGQRYYIKVGLIGVRGQEVLSDYATYIPQ